MTQNIKSVLIVDDQSAARSILNAILMEAGFQVTGQAANESQALKICTTQPPDIIYLDINLDGTNGLDLLIKFKEQWPHIPVVMITGDPTLERVREAVNRGASGFVAKPFNAKKVIEAANKQVSSKESLKDKGVSIPEDEEYNQLKNLNNSPITDNIQTPIDNDAQQNPSS